MGRGTTRRRPSKRIERPSFFFIIALILGIAFLIWVFTRVISRPPTGRIGSTSVVGPGMARIVRTPKA